MKEKKVKIMDRIILIGLVCLEVSFLLFLFSFIPKDVIAAVGEDNATLPAFLTIGNSFPEIINITVQGDNTIDLTANNSTTVTVLAIIRDFNGEADIQAVTSEFFDSALSLYGDNDDNNTHYTNHTCFIDASYGDGDEVNATCTYQVQYYANNATWNATIFVNDSLASTTNDTQQATINTLLAFAIPENINYGEVNGSAVSQEQTLNVSNAGNVIVNFTLSSYAAAEADNLSMNCTLGATKTIADYYQKFNLTVSQPGPINLTDFELNYTNITGTPTVKTYNLPQRQNDTLNEATNETYWRIYVPLGVAGSCQGNVIFGAVQSAES